MRRGRRGSEKKKAATVAAPTSTTSTSTTTTTSTTTAAPSGPTLAPATVSGPDTISSSPFSLTGTCTEGSSVTLGGDVAAENVTEGLSVNCSSSKTYSFSVTLEDGSYNFSVGTSDGKTSYSTPHSLEIDSTAPDAPVIVTPSTLVLPAGTTGTAITSGDPILTIGGTCEDGATVDMAVSGSATDSSSQTCSSAEFSFTFSGVASTDVYNFAITQTDSAGNVSNQADLQWTYDTGIPEQPTVDPVSSLTNSFPTITGACQNSSQVFLYNEAYAEVLSPITCLASTFSVTLTATEVPADGVYKFYVTQRNINGESPPVAFGFTFDQTVLPPNVTFPGVSPYTVQGPFLLVGECEDGADVRVYWDSLSINTASTLDVTPACTDGVFSLEFDETADGTYDYLIKQTDAAGNESTTTAQQWIRDTNTVGAPVITSPAASPYESNEDVLVLSGNCTTGNTVNLFEDVDAYTASIASTTCEASYFSLSIDKSADTNDTAYNFKVGQTDANSASSDLGTAPVFTWNRDITPPTVTITTVPDGSRYHPFFEFTVDDGTATTECNLNSSGWTSCTSPHETGVLANENQVFEVRATDTVGNVGAVASHSWTQNAYATVALYHMDSADPLADASNNALSLTSSGSPTSVTGYTDPGFAEGFQFNPINPDSLSSSFDSILEKIDRKFTVELWFKIANRPAAQGDLLPLIQIGDFDLSLEERNGGGNPYFINVGSISINDKINLPINEWFHIAVTHDLNSTTIYVNGNSVWNSTPNTFNSTPVSAGLEIGGPSSIYYFDGVIDEVRISQTVRYTGNFTPPSEPFTVD